MRLPTNRIKAGLRLHIKADPRTRVGLCSQVGLHIRTGHRIRAGLRIQAVLRTKVGLRIKARPSIPRTNAPSTILHPNRTRPPIPLPRLSSSQTPTLQPLH
jgi:hypothetical protein